MNLGSVVIGWAGWWWKIRKGSEDAGGDGLDLKAVGREEADVVLNLGSEFGLAHRLVIERLDLDGERNLKELARDDGLLPRGRVEAVAAAVNQFCGLVQQSLIKASGVGLADGSSVGSGERDEDLDGGGFHSVGAWLFVGLVAVMAYPTMWRG
jgi:hypothetical protein